MGREGSKLASVPGWGRYRFFTVSPVLGSAEDERWQVGPLSHPVTTFFLVDSEVSPRTERAGLGTPRLQLGASEFSQPQRKRGEKKGRTCEILRASRARSKLGHGGSRSGDEELTALGNLRESSFIVGFPSFAERVSLIASGQRPYATAEPGAECRGSICSE